MKLDLVEISAVSIRAGFAFAVVRVVVYEVFAVALHFFLCEIAEFQ